MCVVTESLSCCSRPHSTTRLRWPPRRCVLINAHSDNYLLVGIHIQGLDCSRNAWMHSRLIR